MSASALLDPEIVPLKDTDHFRKTLLESTSIVVFEGLPHQAWQPMELKKELQRQDVTKIWNFPFYTPALKATNAEQLQRLLGSSASVRVYGGPKACGGYHPDYAVVWTTRGLTYHALICLGCHEVVFFDGIRSFKYDFAEKVDQTMKQLLKPYSTKRPKWQVEE